MNPLAFGNTNQFRQRDHRLHGESKSDWPFSEIQFTRALPTTTPSAISPTGRKHEAEEMPKPTTTGKSANHNGLNPLGQVSGKSFLSAGYTLRGAYVQKTRRFLHDHWNPLFRCSGSNDEDILHSVISGRLNKLGRFLRRKVQGKQTIDTG